MTRTVMSDKEWADLEKFGKKLKKEIQIRLLQSGKPVGVDMAFVRELNGAEIWTYDTDGASSKEVSWDLRLFYEDVYLKDGKTIEEIADEMATVGIEEYGRPLRQSLCPKEFNKRAERIPPPQSKAQVGDEFRESTILFRIQRNASMFARKNFRKLFSSYYP